MQKNGITKIKKPANGTINNQVELNIAFERLDNLANK